MTAIVIIPTYNEKPNLSTMVSRLFQANPEVHLIIVDDNSPDGTGELADQIAAESESIFALHRPGKGGLATAYLDGFRWAIERDYGYVVEMDADGSHRPEDLVLLLERAELSDKPDLVIGSRWVRGGQVENWPKKREILSRAGNTYVGILLGIKIHDATAGFRVYKVDFLKRLDLNKVEPKGYYFQVEMTQIVDDNDGKIVEVPITFCERLAGDSKMSGGIIFEALYRASKSGIKKRIPQLASGVKDVTKDITQKVTQKLTDRAGETTPNNAVVDSVKSTIKNTATKILRIIKNK